MTNKTLIGNSSSMISSGAFQAIVAFASNLILVRYISPSDFGVFAIILSNATLLGALTNLRINDLILRSSEEELERDISSYYAYAAFQSLVISIGGVVLLTIVGQLNLYAMILLFAITITPFIQLSLVQYERKLNYGSIAVIESSSTLISHVMAVLGVLSGLGAIVLYLRILIQTLCLAFGLYIKKAWTKMPQLSFSPNHVSDIFSKSKWIWLDSNLEQGIDKLTIIFSNYIASTSDIGMFFQARRLSVTPHQLLQPFTTRVLLNYFSKESAEGKTSLLNRVLLFEIIVLGIAAIILYYFGLEIIRFLFGNTWESVYDILIALLGIVLFLSIFNTFKAYYISEKNTKTFTMYGRISLVIGILISYFSLPVYIELSPIIRLASAISSGYAFASIIICIKYRFDIGNKQDV